MARPGLSDGAGPGLTCTCTQAISAGAAPALLEATWRAHAGTLAAGVTWDGLPLQDLLDIARWVCACACVCVRVNACVRACMYVCAA